MWKTTLQLRFWGLQAELKSPSKRQFTRLATGGSLLCDPLKWRYEAYEREPSYFLCHMQYRTIHNIREPLVQRHKPVSLASQSPERLLTRHFPHAKDISAGLGSQLSSCLHVGGMGNREAFEKNEKSYADCITWENMNEFLKKS